MTRFLGLLLLVACGADAPSGPSAAERIENEQPILAQHRKALEARELLMASLLEEKPSADPAMRPATSPLDPAPSYPSYGRGARNVFFLWALGNSKNWRPFPDDRIKLLRLSKRARSETPPDKPWDGDLKRDIEQVLSRHIALAIPTELTMPRLPGKSSEFISGSCRAELRILDGETRKVLATGFCEASSSESFKVQGSKETTGRNAAMMVTIDFARQLGGAMSRTFKEMVGGNWQLGVN